MKTSANLERDFARKLKGTELKTVLKQIREVEHKDPLFANRLGIIARRLRDELKAMK